MTSQAIPETGGLGLDDALSYLELLAEQRPDRADRVAVRWLGRFCLESEVLTLREAQLAHAMFPIGTLWKGKLSTLMTPGRSWPNVPVNPAGSPAWRSANVAVGFSAPACRAASRDMEGHAPPQMAAWFESEPSGTFHADVWLKSIA